MTTGGFNLSEAAGWNPEAGDVIIGRVVDVDIGWSEFRGDYPILTIAPDNGEPPVKVHAFHDVLFRRLVTLRPAVGETIGIQYHGKAPHKSKPTQTVANYSVRIKGRGADVASLYDRLSAPPAAQEPRATFRPPRTAPGQQTMGQRAAGVEPEGAPAHDDDDIPF